MTRTRNVLVRWMDWSLTVTVIGIIWGIGPMTPPTEKGRSWKMRPTVLIGEPSLNETWYDG